MNIEHIKASDVTTNKWSGGTTTQLAIYPKDADYKKQDFLFRLSTARVETQESTFTQLPGVSRKIMILDGEIKIEHQNHYTKVLKKFEQDSFEGEWETKSYGKAIDFNLMTKGTAKGEIEIRRINDSEKTELKLDAHFTIIYIYSGEIKYSDRAKMILANKGGTIFIQKNIEDEKIELIASKKSELIIAKVCMNP